MNADLITPEESVRLCELERVIQKGKDTFVEVGNALSEIRDSRIYRATFKTFEEYCQKRWDMGRDYAERLISSASVVSNLPTDGGKPTSEWQARPLTKIPAEKQPEAWAKAQELAKEDGKKISVRHVEAAVAEVMPKIEEIEAVIVDGVSESAEAPKRRPSVKIIEDEGMNIWLLAKSHLSRINKHDTQREQALRACVDYCQSRLESKK